MNIYQVHSETNIGEYLLNCYYRSENNKKYAAGLFCGRMLIRIFNKKPILEILNIFMKEELEENSYEFRQFYKGLVKGLDEGRKPS